MNQQQQFPAIGAQASMIELNGIDAANASGGCPIVNAFLFGYAIGTAIDQAYIKPLWNN